IDVFISPQFPRFARNDSLNLYNYPSDFSLRSKFTGVRMAFPKQEAKGIWENFERSEKSG
ncbi:MAG: hypothetical protein L6Q97_25375, partial [Thermoanaerobaculia bacterium]|nr:hypothetical protein [Thermoanaerobaculia bacterium]